MLGRWRYLARSQTLREIVNLMLRGSFLDANILGPEAEPYLAAFARSRLTGSGQLFIGL